MKFKELAENITRDASGAKLALERNKPTIYIFAGIAAVVTGTVLMCKASRKVDDILDEHVEKLEEVKEGPVEPTKKEVTDVYISTAKQLVKLYAVPVAIEAAGIFCIAKGDMEHRDRNASLAAAYATLDGIFKRYRERVVEKEGKDADFRYRHGLKEETITVEEVDEDGKTHKVKKKILADEGCGAEGYSDYAKFFDETCKGYDDNPESNLSFLKIQQNFANDKLRSQGYLFLNDIYDMLGIERTKAGQVMGFLYDRNNPTAALDFGIYQIKSEAARRFVNGYEPVILLDFTYDGELPVNILDQM